MSRTLSADVIEAAARYGATVHCHLTWSDGRSKVRVLARRPSRALISELEDLVRKGGFPDQRVTFDGPDKFRLDAR